MRNLFTANQNFSSKKLSDIDSEIERAVFIAKYNSIQQKRRRNIAAIILSLKHAVRGVLFSWPLYLLPLSVLALPEKYKYLFIFFLLPGLYVSFIILKKGIYEDYASYVSGRILHDTYKISLLFAKLPS